MSMVVTVPDRVADRLRLLAIERGTTVSEAATDLLEASPELPLIVIAVDEDEDPLEAFFGCGDSGDARQMTIHEMRRDLAARKFAGGVENI
jgi:hypothetical protein